METIEKFDFNTIKDFDTHIAKSIPNYDILINSIKSISEYFFVENCTVYDLGCSTGELLKSLNCDCRKIGYDNSSLLPNDSNFINTDLNEKIEIENACLVYSIFTMQFLNPNKRINYLKQIYEGLNSGGALIICEKIYQENGKIQDIMAFSYYDYKLTNFTATEIMTKERDLRFIMKPNSYTELFEMLEIVGFKTVSSFWEMFNFKGIIAIKK